MRLAALLVFALSVAPAQAQTVETTINWSVMDWGVIDIPRSVETDGDFATREWLIRRQFTGEMRLVAERHGGYCLGPWFTPVVDIFRQTATIDRVGLVHKLFVRELFTQQMQIVALDTPQCEP